MILETWEFRSKDSIQLSILPDGCRDVIWTQKKGAAPTWFISPLQDTTRLVRIDENTWSRGYRISAGAQIKEEALLASLEAESGGWLLRDRLESFSRLTTQMREALSCLSVSSSVAGASARLGVSPRTLQRLCLGESERSPSFWLRLSRVRRAARSLKDFRELKEVAFDFGFADQAHMTREFRNWMGLTPASFAQTPKLLAQVHERAYP